MLTGRINKYKKGKGHESLPIELLQDDKLSLEAIGLLSSMHSLSDNCVLNKTELYKYFPKNKQSTIDRIWNELIENKYLINIKKSEEDISVSHYFFSVIPFTDEEIKTITEL